jgi:4-hydroxy-3-polyprenylbenzoate decarboxylase
MEKQRKIILGITGASGSVYARLLLERLCSLPVPPASIAVILTETAEEVWLHETGSEFSVNPLAKRYPVTQFNAPFASGSSDYDTMIICPASMGTTGRIAHGTSDNLIIRAADVILKERKRLIIVPREAPYSLIHLRNMETLTLAGAIICPASPSFYSRPTTVEEVAMTIVERILTLAGFETDTYRWKGYE